MNYELAGASLIPTKRTVARKKFAGDGAMSRRDKMLVETCHYPQSACHIGTLCEPAHSVPDGTAGYVVGFVFYQHGVPDGTPQTTSVEKRKDTYKNLITSFKNK